ncbi:MAG TPA: hypothetical protein VMU35_05460 [Methylomirabilota bacterium]|nr:hypothetical protein [Methylomirabilota bacterium]
MGDFKCIACGTSCSSEEALRAHAKTKISEESIHYRMMSAHGQTDPIFPTGEEKPR